MSDICPLISLKWPWFRFPKGQSGTSIALTLKIRMSEKNAPWVPRGPWGHPQILSFFDSFFLNPVCKKHHHSVASATNVVQGDDIQPVQETLFSCPMQTRRDSSRIPWRFNLFSETVVHSEQGGG